MPYNNNKLLLVHILAIQKANKKTPYQTSFHSIKFSFKKKKTHEF